MERFDIKTTIQPYAATIITAQPVLAITASVGAGIEIKTNTENEIKLSVSATEAI